MTPEDKETTPGEPLVVATTFIAAGGVVAASACASSVWLVSCVAPNFSCFRALLVLYAFCELLRPSFVLCR